GHEVGLAEPPHLTLSHNPLQGAHGVLGTASRSEAIRALEKVWLVDGLQHRAHGVLDPFILERRDANRPRRALALGEVNPSDGLMAIPLGLQPRVQRLEIRLSALSVWLLRDPIHAHRRRCTLATLGPLPSWHSNQMRQ